MKKLCISLMEDLSTFGFLTVFLFCKYCIALHELAVILIKNNFWNISEEENLIFYCIFLPNELSHNLFLQRNSLSQFILLFIAHILQTVFRV